MSGAAELAHVVRQWIEKAEEDLTNAEHTLTLLENCPLSTVCFHAQQCAEKYLKALLVSLSLDFPKSHDLGELLLLIPEGLRPPLDASEEERLTLHAVDTRYPGEWEPITRGRAEAAVAVARRVREAVRRHLPGEALG